VSTTHLRDLSDEHLRAAGSLKWALDGPDVIPAWIAEMDFALADPIQWAVSDYAARGVFGYADPYGSVAVPEALAGFAKRQWGHTIDPAATLVTGDVMEAIALTLRWVAPSGPIIIPTPVYPPFLVLSTSLDREICAVPLVREAAPDADAQSTSTSRLTLDLDGIEAQARAGARTLLLCQPHNPVGRCFTRAELVALRDVVEPLGVHVISDEIHAALTLPGFDFVPYASVASPEAPVTTVISATKAFSMPGLRCAQLISHRPADHATLGSLHPVLNHSMTTLGQHASVAAYTHGDGWLDEVRVRIAANHHAFREAMAEVTPAVTIERPEATYLSWLDVSGVAHRDPVAAALAQGVRVDSQGLGYGAGSTDRIRVNLATSPDRVAQIAARLGAAWA